MLNKIRLFVLGAWWSWVVVDIFTTVGEVSEESIFTLGDGFMVLCFVVVVALLGQLTYKSFSKYER